MEFHDVLKNRFSVRKFSPKVLESKKLLTIIESVLKAPSGGGLQAYKIYLVRSQEAKEALMIAADSQECVMEAQCVLVFCADQRRSGHKYGGRGEDLFCVQDATIAAAYAQLSATAEGLASVWVGAFEPLEVARIVNATSFEVPVVMIPIGYAIEGTIREKHVKRPLKEMVIEV